MRKRVRRAKGKANFAITASATFLRLHRQRLGMAARGAAILVVALAAFLPQSAEAIPAYPWSANSEPVVADGSWGLLSMVPAAPAFIMPAPDDEAPADDERDVVSEVRNDSRLTVADCAAVCEPVTDIEAIIYSYPWSAAHMVRIMYCESGGDPSAYNPAGYYGLFQIDYEFSGWDDPATNVAAAYAKYVSALNGRGDGLTPWPACRWY